MAELVFKTIGDISRFEKHYKERKAEKWADVDAVLNALVQNDVNIVESRRITNAGLPSIERTDLDKQRFRDVYLEKFMGAFKRREGISDIADRTRQAFAFIDEPPPAAAAPVTGLLPDPPPLPPPDNGIRAAPTLPMGLTPPPAAPPAAAAPPQPPVSSPVPPKPYALPPGLSLDRSKPATEIPGALQAPTTMGTDPNRVRPSRITRDSNPSAATPAPPVTAAPPPATPPAAAPPQAPAPPAAPPEPIRVRVGRTGDTTRYFLEVPEGVAVTPNATDNALTLNFFNKPVRFDIRDTEANRPATVKSIDADTNPNALRFEFNGKPVAAHALNGRTYEVTVPNTAARPEVGVTVSKEDPRFTRYVFDMPEGTTFKAWLSEYLGNREGYRIGFTGPDGKLLDVVKRNDEDLKSPIMDATVLKDMQGNVLLRFPHRGRAQIEAPVQRGNQLIVDVSNTLKPEPQTAPLPAAPSPPTATPAPQAQPQEGPLPARIDVNSQPGHTRYTLRLPAGTTVQKSQEAGKLTLRFNKDLQFDREVDSLPSWVKGITPARGNGTSSLSFDVDPKSQIRTPPTWGAYSVEVYKPPEAQAAPPRQDERTHAERRRQQQPGQGAGANPPDQNQRRRQAREDIPRPPGLIPPPQDPHQHRTRERTPRPPSAWRQNIPPRREPELASSGGRASLKNLMRELYPTFGNGENYRTAENLARANMGRNLKVNALDKNKAIEVMADHRLGKGFANTLLAVAGQKADDALTDKRKKTHMDAVRRTLAWEYQKGGFMEDIGLELKRGEKTSKVAYRKALDQLKGIKDDVLARSYVFFLSRKFNAAAGKTRRAEAPDGNPAEAQSAGVKGAKNTLAEAKDPVKSMQPSV